MSNLAIGFATVALDQNSAKLHVSAFQLGGPSAYTLRHPGNALICLCHAFLEMISIRLVILNYFLQERVLGPMISEES